MNTILNLCPVLQQNENIHWRRDQINWHIDSDGIPSFWVLIMPKKCQYMHERFSNLYFFKMLTKQKISFYLDPQN